MQGLCAEHLQGGLHIVHQSAVDGGFALQIAEKLGANIGLLFAEDEAGDFWLVFDAADVHFVEVDDEAFGFEELANGFYLFFFEAFFARKSHVVDEARVGPAFVAGQGFEVVVGAEAHEVGEYGRGGHALREFVFVGGELGEQLGHGFWEVEGSTAVHLKNARSANVRKEVFEVEMQQPLPVFADVPHGIGVDVAHVRLVLRGDEATVGAVGPGGEIDGLEPLLDVPLDFVEGLVGTLDEPLVAVGLRQEELYVLGPGGVLAQLLQRDAEVLCQRFYGAHGQKSLGLHPQLVTGGLFFLNDGVGRIVVVHGGWCLCFVSLLCHFVIGSLRKSIFGLWHSEAEGHKKYKI